MQKLLSLLLTIPLCSSAQLRWTNVDSLYQPLPSSVHVYYTNDSIDGKPNIAYYVEAQLRDKHLNFATDTTRNRRLTPKQYFEKDGHPLLVVNCTFFEFVHNSNLDIVMNNGKLLAHNQPIAGRGKDTFTYQHPYVGAIGVSKKRKADVAWTYADTLTKVPYAMQSPLAAKKDSTKDFAFDSARNYSSIVSHHLMSSTLKKWKMKTAVGGGPVLLQNGEIKITNNEELRFAGKAINDKHPRTSMGYTKDGKLIIMVIQGRFANIAEGATLPQEAQMLKDIGCWEALNLDGGGSSCLLVNGKETIKPSDKQERPVPAVFIIQERSGRN